MKISKISPLILIIILVIALFPYPCSATSVKRSQHILTKAELIHLFSAISLYQNDKGHLPKTEKEFTQELILSKPPYIQPRQTRSVSIKPEELKEGIYYFDTWGNPFRYLYIKAADTEDYNIYSYGVNEIDEKGGGDDIVLNEYIYWSDKDNCFLIDKEAKAFARPTDKHPVPKTNDRVYKLGRDKGWFPFEFIIVAFVLATFGYIIINLFPPSKTTANSPARQDNSPSALGAEEQKG